VKKGSYPYPVLAKLYILQAAWENYCSLTIF
jgi:hypothetical protein